MIFTKYIYFSQSVIYHRLFYKMHSFLYTKVQASNHALGSQNFKPFVPVLFLFFCCFPTAHLWCSYISSNFQVLRVNWSLVFNSETSLFNLMGGLFVYLPFTRVPEEKWGKPMSPRGSLSLRINTKLLYQSPFLKFKAISSDIKATYLIWEPKDYQKLNSCVGSMTAIFIFLFSLFQLQFFLTL